MPMEYNVLYWLYEGRLYVGNGPFMTEMLLGALNSIGGDIKAMR